MLPMQYQEVPVKGLGMAARQTTKLKFNKRRIAGFTGNQLKTIAFIFMLCDHIGYILIENGVLYGSNPIYWNMAIATPEGQRWYLLAQILRTVGRLSFPIFAFLVVEGVAYTRSVRRYLLRLFIFALISEVPFDLAIMGRWWDTGYQNVLFTLLLGAMAAALIKSLKKRNIILRIIPAAVCCFLAWLIRSDYGAVGVLMISAMYLVREDRNAMLIVGVLAAAAESIDYACVSALAFIFIYFYNGRRGDFPLKYFFYFAYPASLILLRAMVYFANR